VWPSARPTMTWCSPPAAMGLLAYGAPRRASRTASRWSTDLTLASQSKSKPQRSAPTAASSLPVIPRDSFEAGTAARANSSGRWITGAAESIRFASALPASKSWRGWRFAWGLSRRRHSYSLPPTGEPSKLLPKFAPNPTRRLCSGGRLSAKQRRAESVRSRSRSSAAAPRAERRQPSTWHRALQRSGSDPPRSGSDPHVAGQTRNVWVRPRF